MGGGMTTKANRAAARLQGELTTARELNDELRKALYQCQKDHAKACIDATTYKRLYENQQKFNGTVSDRLRHAERLVRTLTDALADKYHPLPTNVNVKMDYRIAGNVDAASPSEAG